VEAGVIAPLTIQPADPTGQRAHPIEFIEVGGGSTLAATPAAVDLTPIAGGLTPVAGDLTPADEPAVIPPGPILPEPEPGWSLWGDAER
jgi:hypothetical protein